MNLKKYREYYFDNLKLLLITLVVIGHTIEPLIGSYLNIKLLYTLIYSFHMPLFVFTSGYFSKNINTDEKFFSKINTIFVPYIIFQLLYSLFNIYILKAQNFKITFVYPYWITWYLLSLFIWTLILPYFSKIKYSIIITIFISILCGYDNTIGYYLSLSRTITFFPYFLIGYFTQRHHINIIKQYITKKYAISALLIISILFYLMNTKIDYRWFYGSFSYSQLNSSIYPNYIIRTVIYGLAIIISISVLILIPDKKFFFTHLGSRSMTVYIFHGFIIKLLLKYKFFDYIDCLKNEIFIIVLSLFIVIILSSKYINKIGKILIYPRLLKQATR
ncbi:acyltransferase family protein [Clostridium sp. WILCCON 0269]|uniref:Acyltransferase family protein n=1 Tax=Candidatus Clostridium eludens TaxID=3381663 RepID=A0ABW8SP07_9CLOT